MKQVLMEVDGTTAVDGTLGHVEDGDERSASAFGRTTSGNVPPTETTAGQIIARNYFARRYCKYVKKKILVERLILEDAVGRGVVRLVLYSLIFVLIVACLNFGSSSEDKRRVMTLLQSDLELDDWKDVTSIGQLREVLPRLSESLKKYSASSSTRFDSDDSVVILQENQHFPAARQLFSVEPVVTGSFTFTAWVGGMPNRVLLGEKVSIIRKPMESERTQSCWGWFHPSTFRYGAHDFHSLQSNEFEEVVNGTGFLPSTLTHEAIIVENGIVSFFRNGRLLGEPQVLPRPVTDCLAPAPLELGGKDIELSALLFYPRALQPSDIDEMFQAGQPLVEVATASTLQEAEEDSLNQVESAVTVSQRDLTEEIRKSTLENRINAIMDRETQVDHLQSSDEEDPSPPPILPKGDSVLQELSTVPDQGLEDSDLQYWLNSPQRQRWIEGGRRTTGYANSTWAEDEFGRHWSVFEHPVLCDGTPFGTLPNFDPQSDGMTVSFWFKASKTRLGTGPNLRVVQGPEVEDGGEATFFDVSAELDWFALTMQVNGADNQYAWRYATGFEQDTGKVNENFLLYSFAQTPKPNVWRHMVFQFSMATKSILLYLDGVLFVDTKDDSSYGGTCVVSSGTVANVFNGATVVPHSFSALSSMRDIAGTMAQLRFYDRLLSADEIVRLHSVSEWRPGVPMKQCKDGSTDMTYADTLRTDFYGNPCSWWYSVAQEYPWVCSAEWLKDMCPVSCSSVRLCHDGKLNQGDTVLGTPREAPRRKYKIFDRIMHLKPKDGQTGIICPSKTVDKATVLESCRALGGPDAEFYETNENEYYRISSRTNKNFNRADLRNCDDLEARLDYEQCAWDSSWAEDFAQDFEETKKWSISTWVRPKDGSLGWPTNFWFAFTLFSTMSPPLILADFQEREPTLEPWMEAHTVVTDASGNPKRGRGDIWPTTVIDYTGSWTFIHMQFQSKPDGTYEMCATLNAMKLNCMSSTGSNRFDPLRFIEALEITTEMLVSPIEITTEWFSPSEVQQKYYSKASSMEKVLGPLSSERDRLAELTAPSIRQNRQFDQTIILMAPPLIFQRRAVKRSCESKVTTPFLESQLKLIQAAQCTDSLCPNATTIDEVAVCTGEEKDLTGRYFGQPKLPLDGQEGYTDFLFAIADNPLVVRDGVILDTATFFDAQSVEGIVLAFFHLAETGLTTELKLTVSFSGTSLETDLSFEHYNFVSEEKRPDLLFNYALLFLCILTIMICNLKFFLMFRQECKVLGVKFDRLGRFEISYDMFQSVVLLSFVSVALINALQSEEVAQGIVKDIAGVPFESATIALENKIGTFFEAVATLHSAFAQNAAIDVFAFITMVLMLVRIIDATAVHPRTGVLVGTLLHGLNDLWHFTLLFLVVFFFFAYTSSWMFSSEREDFADLFVSMQTQFNIILGELPEDFEEDNKMIVYVVFSIVVQFFLMLNFLLAIVVEGYMKVRLDIEANESEGEFLADVVLTIMSYFKSWFYGWPHRRYVALVVRDRVGSRAVSGYHLVLQGLPHEAVTTMFSHYAGMSHLACGPPEWLLPANRYEVVDRVEKEAVKISVENLNSQLSAMRLQLSRVLGAMPGAALGPTSPTAMMAPPPVDDGGVLSHAIHARIKKQSVNGSSHHLSHRRSLMPSPTGNGSPMNGHYLRKNTSQDLSSKEVTITSPRHEDGNGTNDPEASGSNLRTVDLLVKQRKESQDESQSQSVHGTGMSNGLDQVRDEDFYMALQGGPGLQQLGKPKFMF